MQCCSAGVHPPPGVRSGHCRLECRRYKEKSKELTINNLNKLVVRHFEYPAYGDSITPALRLGFVGHI